MVFKNATGMQWFAGFFIGILCNFLDTLGCGSYAPSTALYKIFNNQDDIDIPGTLNVGDTFPVIFEAFIKTGRFDAVATLGNMIGGCLGVFLAWKVVTSLPLFWLINLVCVVLLFTSYQLISSAIKDKKAGIE